MKRKFCTLVLLSLILPLWAAKSPVAPEVDMESMVLLEAGQFEMGWPESAVGPYGDPWYIDQQPARTISLSSYAIDITEVTTEAYAQFLTYAGGEMYFHERQPINRVRDGYLAENGAEQEPMRNLSWYAARDYCRWAGKRLPTEAEWAFALRGPSNRVFPWVEGGPNCQRSNFFTGSSHCVGGPREVGKYPDGASPDGVMDLTGNVAEWTGDDYAAYDPESTKDPRVETGGMLKVVRGGGWMDPPQALRGHSRRAVRAELKSENIGFRCAWSEGTTLDAFRGSLSAPEDIERQQNQGVSASVSKEPITLLDGLITPKGLARFENSWLISDTGFGTVWRLFDDTPSPEIIIEGLKAPTHIEVFESAAWILDRDGLQVLRWRAETTEPEIIATLTSPPERLAVDEKGALVASSTTIYDLSTDPPSVVLDNLDGISALELKDGLLYVAVLGSSNIANARLLRATRSGEGVSNIVGQNILQGVFHIPAITWKTDTNTLQFPIIRAGWPYSGVITHLSSSNQLISGTHTPPGTKWLQPTSKGLIIGCTHTLIQSVEGQPYSVLMPWTSPSAISTDGENGIAWIDAKSGKLFFIGL